jgi:hypothetical protein
LPSLFTIDYFKLYYEQEVAEWLLVPFTDKYFKKPKVNKEGKTIAESMRAYGYDVLERVEDYDFDELD